MIAFCHTYKTAGTSFNTILRNHYRNRHFDSPGFQHRALTPENLKRLKWIYPNLASIIGHTIKPYAGLQQVDPDMKFYTFLRDPVARSISHVTWFLRWKANDGIFYDDFDQLLIDWARAADNKNRQCRQLSREGSFEGVKKIVQENPFLFLRVEHFDRSLFLFRQWTGETNMNLAYRQRNTGADSHERIQSDHPEYLEKIRAFQRLLKQDEGKQAILLEANREDQALHDWVEAEIWPKQISQYQGNLDEEVVRFKADLEQNPPDLREPLISKLQRNLVLKPLRPILLPAREPAEALSSPWL